MIEYIDDATTYLEGRTIEQLSSDRKSIAAIERCLQCVTEAAIKIGAERLAAIAPDVPMQAIRGLGNRLRHAYDDIDLGIVHQTVIGDLPVLRAACVIALEQYG